MHERRLARRAAEIADVVGVARHRDGVAEEVLVAEGAEPTKDVFRFEGVDAGAERHRERELVDVDRERGLPAVVEEAIDVAADRVRELLADQIDDGVDVAGLETTDHRILEAEAELVEQTLQPRGDLRRALHRLLACVGDGVEPLAEVRGDRRRGPVARHSTIGSSP